MRSTHLLTISSQAALSEADCTASRSERSMHCKSFLTTSIHLRRGRPRGRRMSVVLIDIWRAWKEDDSAPSLTTWPNHSSLRNHKTEQKGNQTKQCRTVSFSQYRTIFTGLILVVLEKLWNPLPHEFQSAANNAQFKRCLKAFYYG